MLQSFIDVLTNTASFLEMIANLAIIITVIRFFWSKRIITFKLGSGKQIRMKACDLNPSTATNAISAKYHNGGTIDAADRAEIIERLGPKWE